METPATDCPWDVCKRKSNTWGNDSIKCKHDVANPLFLWVTLLTRARRWTCSSEEIVSSKQSRRREQGARSTEELLFVFHFQFRHIWREFFHRWSPDVMRGGFRPATVQREKCRRPKPPREDVVGSRVAVNGSLFTVCSLCSHTDNALVTQWHGCHSWLWSYTHMLPLGGLIVCISPW